MTRKWFWALLVAAVGVAVYAGNVLATGSQAFSGVTLATATFGDLDIKAKTDVDPGKPGPQFWRADIKTKGLSDLYVQQNTWDPALCANNCIPSTGWHTHPGPSLVIVTQGTVTEYDGDDPTCTPHVYSATGTNSFVDIGGGAVHMIRNESGAVAKTVAVQLIPSGATRRQDAGDPENCPF